MHGKSILKNKCIMAENANNTNNLSWNFALLIALILVFVLMTFNFKSGKIVNKESVLESIGSTL